MNYFYIRKIYMEMGRSTGHAIQAKDVLDALRILITHKIGDKFPNNIPTRIEAFPAPRFFIEKRKRHIGGKIYYEDNNGNLQYVEKLED